MFRLPSHLLAAPVAVNLAPALVSALTVLSGARNQPGQGPQVANFSVGQYLQERYGLKVHANGVAVLPVSGVLWTGADEFDEFCCELYNYDRIKAGLREAAGNSGIRALVLRINSPGGSARGNLEAAQIVEQFAAAVSYPVIAYVDNCCASAAYFVACGADLIVARSNAILGSIGSRIMCVDASKQVAEAGLDIRIYTADSDLKALGESAVPWPEEWHEHFRNWTARYSEEFKSYVMRRRSGAVRAEMRGGYDEARHSPAWMMDSNGEPDFEEFIVRLPGSGLL